MKLLVAGSRNKHPKEEIEEQIMIHNPSILIHGGAKGVDSVAATAAKKAGVPTKVFLPDWASFGRAAGPIRNEAMVLFCDRAIIFWDGKSPGTRNTIELLKKHGKEYKVIKI